MTNIFGKEKSLIFAGGVLVGTLGLKLLKSKTAKKFYVKTLAGGMKIKNDAQNLCETIREDAEDMCYEASKQASEEEKGCCCHSEK
ncbi:DUF1490 domain-containing protein [Clostridium sp. P21]|uniref:DUF1490 domain-containing protein n=1 Tax=Clostridium muellerianum TaxID=2716538 RepID=A0A7Y0HM79_9CLOT|nr:DUF6110 family protein [Clostridium muellerianum]NMM61905.1 DUF1490 domain-containing protein [Clostridium muellerianum]